MLQIGHIAIGVFELDALRTPLEASGFAYTVVGIPGGAGQFSSKDPRP